MKSLKKHNYTAGTTLLEVLVSFSLLTIIMTAMAQFFSATYNYERRLKAKATFEAIAEDIENKLRSPSAIYSSLLDPANLDMTHCIYSVPNACNLFTQTPQSFALNNSYIVARVDELTHAGPPVQHYNLRGLRCNNPDNDSCVFTAETFFYVSCLSAFCSDGTNPKCPDESGAKCFTGSQNGTCANGDTAICGSGAITTPAQCQTTNTCPGGPSEIHVAYQVQQVAGSLSSFGKTFNAIPQNIQFNYAHKISDILTPNVNSSCNSPGAIIIGINSNGSAICKCAQPYIVLTDPSGSPKLDSKGQEICTLTPPEDLTCPSDKVYAGAKEDGTANCLDATLAFDCITITKNRQSWFHSSGKDTTYEASCPGPEYWVSADYRENCSFTCMAGLMCATDEEGGFNSPIEGFYCDSRKLTCCRSIPP